MDGGSIIYNTNHYTLFPLHPPLMNLDHGAICECFVGAMLEPCLRPVRLLRVSISEGLTHIYIYIYIYIYRERERERCVLSVRMLNHNAIEPARQRARSGDAASRGRRGGHRRGHLVIIRRMALILIVYIQCMCVYTYIYIYIYVL